jgi:hypothetical protein
MKKFSIEVISQKPETMYGILSHIGQITIDKFKETFIMPLSTWTLEEYQAQWHNAIERIKNHDTSCLVVSISGIKNENPSVTLWTLYKVGETIFIHNNLLINDTVAHMTVKLSDFNSKTCYQFINPRVTIDEDGEEISEWSIPLSEL